MFSLLPFTFRFRGKVRRLLEIYFCFLDSEEKALHPAQIAKRTGLSFAEVARRMDNTPELFIRMPRRPDGLSRYRITSSAISLDPEDVEAMLRKYERRESWLLYAFVLMILAMLVIVVMITSVIF